MDKIHEKFNKTIDLGYFFESEPQVFAVFKAGYKSADLLPTKKNCPGCKGDGYIHVPDDEAGVLVHKETCPTCKGKKTIPLYYTPEQYEKITGKPFPDDVMVYILYKYWTYAFYKFAKKEGIKSNAIVIVQTAQPAPDADYRPEE